MEKLNIDCLILIFNKLRFNNVKFLHSCLLVNREWCHLVVPILWEKYPYFHKNKTKEKYFNIILSHLSSSSKQLLFNCKIKLPSKILSKPLMLNYISYCKFLKASIVDDIVDTVLKEEIRKNSHNYLKKSILLEQEIYKLFISQCKNIKELVWETSQPLPSFPGALTSFSQLYSLNINMGSINTDDLYEMAQICKNLSELTIEDYSRDTPGIITLIDAQRNLKNLIFSPYIKQGTCEELSKAFARKGRTINKLTLNNTIGVIPHSFLTSFINLNRLRINHNHYHESYEDIKEFQQYLAISEFPNLQYLMSDEISCFKELALLIEKTKGNIVTIDIYTSNKSAENTGMLIEAIANNCPLIENLTTHLGPKDLTYLKSLLLNCKNLINLCLDSLNENDDVGDELLETLTEFSPKSLISINISGYWKYSIHALERFLESYRGRKLLCFNITDYDLRGFIIKEHIEIVRKYADEGIITKSNLLEIIYI
jgi:hypothetical protein